MKLNQDHDFSLFYQNYKDSIYKIIRFLSSDPEEVEDIAQEVFLNLYKAFPNFSPEKGSFYAWAATIAKNTYYTYRKKRKKDLLIEREGAFVESFPVKDDFIQIIETRIVEDELRELFLLYQNQKKYHLIERDQQLYFRKNITSVEHIFENRK